MKIKLHIVLIPHLLLLQFKARPTATVTGSASSCVGGNAKPISVALTGKAPWSLTYRATDINGNITNTTVTNIQTTPYVFNVTPSVTTSYSVTALSDANCTADNSLGNDITGTATISITQPGPTGNISAAAPELCPNTSTVLTATLTGTAPFSLTYYDGTSYTTITPINSNTYTFLLLQRRQVLIVSRH
jgi:hypothetical protein